jgi:hypothetical protein
MDNRTPSGDRREQRANSPEAKAQHEKEQQERLNQVSPKMRKKLQLPEPKESVAENASRREIKNSAKGRTSYDSTSSGIIIPFFNRNVTPYATESSGPKFNLVPIAKQKDLMINHARIYAQQEYDRIMEIVTVLEKQAQEIKRRLEVTDAVHAAEYQFQPVMGKEYWLVWESRKEKTLLVLTGPLDWSTGVPNTYNYITQVRYMGSYMDGNRQIKNLIK